MYKVTTEPDADRIHNHGDTIKISATSELCPPEITGRLQHLCQRQGHPREPALGVSAALP